MVLFDINTVIETGASMTVKRMVAEPYTAAHFGSRKLDTLIASPVYVEMIIEATTKLVDNLLPAELVTVGTKIELEHTAPSSLGMYVSVTARFQRIQGNKLYFDIEIEDDEGVTGSGKHERIIVNKEKLLERARRRLLKR